MTDADRIAALEAKLGAALIRLEGNEDDLVDAAGVAVDALVGVGRGPFVVGDAVVAVHVGHGLDVRAGLAQEVGVGRVGGVAHRLGLQPIGALFHEQRVDDAVGAPPRDRR